jgi:hypothetical protein
MPDTRCLIAVDLLNSGIWNLVSGIFYNNKYFSFALFKI